MNHLMSTLANNFNIYTNEHTIKSIIYILIFFTIDFGSILTLWYINYNKYNIIIFISCTIMLLSYYFFLYCIKLSQITNGLINSFSDVLLIPSACSIVASILKLSWAIDIDKITLFIYLVEDFSVSLVFIFRSNSEEIGKMDKNIKTNLSNMASKILNNYMGKWIKKDIRKDIKDRDNKHNLQKSAKLFASKAVNKFTNGDITKFNSLVNDLGNKSPKDSNKDDIIKKLKDMYYNK